MHAIPGIFGFVWGFFFFLFFFLFAGSKTKTEYQQACLSDPAGKAHVVKRLGFTGRASQAHLGGFGASALCSWTSRATFEGSPAHAGTFWRRAACGPPRAPGLELLSNPATGVHVAVGRAQASARRARVPRRPTPASSLMLQPCGAPSTTGCARSARRPAAVLHVGLRPAQPAPR